MTAPVIPANQWPEGADRHCWDSAGQGYFYGADIRRPRVWLPVIQASDVPMPAGWDWRVPVMRPDTGNPVSAPAIDLRQYAEAVQYAIDGLLESGCSSDRVVAKKLRSLLALIDGQANVRSSSEHSSEVAADLVTDDAVRRLVRAMENTPGDDLIEPNTRLCRRLLAAALQPTKGEGE